MTEQKVPWHRVSFVWMLIALPLAAVVAGFTMLWLAIKSDDGLVTDDYYKRGKEINRELSRDRAAAALGLSATLEMDAAGKQLRVRLSATPDVKLPDQVEMRFFHATRAGLDRMLLLPRTGFGTYQIPFAELAPGRWYLQLAAQAWRLTGSVSVPGQDSANLMPALPDPKAQTQNARGSSRPKK